MQAERFYSVEDDGLRQPWNAFSVWLNPPYGRGTRNRSNQEIWSQHCLFEWEAGHVGNAIMLLNAVPERRWFQALWAFDICFTDHRISFNGPDARKAPTHGNVFIYLPRRHGYASARRAFREVFSQFGPVVPGGVAWQRTAA